VTGTPLRIAEPTGRYRRSLRRYLYSSEAACGAGGYCNASADTGIVTELERITVSGDDWPHDDPQWPRACEACGQPFPETACWQRNDNAVYRLPDNTEFVFGRSLGRCAPAGTMIRAAWYDEYAGQPGESWLIALPDGGDWITTQRATGGGYWTVTGTPPDITASPSIWHNAPEGWHGFVRDGFLEGA
jgi:Family of unknown function (DUF6527)